MSKRITVSISEENVEFLREHPEITPSGLLQKALNEYKNVIEQHRKEMEVEA